MSTYMLNKMIREINRDPRRRQAYFDSPADFAQAYQITDEERRAFLERDIGKLYKLGVHGLILRPFTLLHKMPEPEYLRAIRT
ncbi:MAG: hypothetical protein AB7O43_08460 [Hyphomicrobiaceae bacterium]